MYKTTYSQKLVNSALFLAIALSLTIISSVAPLSRASAQSTKIITTQKQATALKGRISKAQRCLPVNGIPQPGPCYKPVANHHFVVVEDSSNNLNRPERVLGRFVTNAQGAYYVELPSVKTYTKVRIVSQDGLFDWRLPPTSPFVNPQQANYFNVYYPIY